MSKRKLFQINQDTDETMYDNFINNSQDIISDPLVRLEKTIEDMNNKIDELFAILQSIYEILESNIEKNEDDTFFNNYCPQYIS